MANVKHISIIGANENNLKNVSIDIPKGQFVVVSGMSGSGKSSLVFDTVHIEGRRKYMESLPSYSRQFLGANAKADVTKITGLSPTISIEQKSTSRNSRSTVATLTEIYDYLRALFSGIGKPYSPATGLEIKKDSPSSIINRILELPDNSKIRICAPLITKANENLNELLNEIRVQGFQRVKINNKVADLENAPRLKMGGDYKIEIIIDRAIIKDNNRARVIDSIELAMKKADGNAKIDIVSIGDNQEKEFTLSNGQKAICGESIFFSDKFACPDANITIPYIEPKIFSFNNPIGACTKCTGIGNEYNFKTELLVNTEISLEDGAMKPWFFLNRRYYSEILRALSKHYKFSLSVPFKELDNDIQDMLLNGSKGEKIEFTFQDAKFGKNVIKQEFKGMISDILEQEDDDLDYLNEYKDYVKCSECKGHRLRKEILTIKINGKNISEVTSMNLKDALSWFEDLPNHLSEHQIKIAKAAIDEIKKRLEFSIEVGLSYLTLSRESSTLSGGESQRIRLSSQLGSGLSGVIYILDEPSIGLHQSDNNRLIDSLKKLKAAGNSVIVVEHDEATIRNADYLIDVGPGAGKFGGNIIAEGTPAEVAKNKNSITGDYLALRKIIEGNKAVRKFGNNITMKLTNARSNNLKNVDLSIPLGKLVAVSGVSGGGKSTLIIETLCKALMKKIHNSNIKPGLHDELINYESIDKAIRIDQAPIGRTPRSNPATYTGMFSLIRDIFAATPDSKIRGYKNSRFSFNIKGGRCESCKGDGSIKAVMHFLPDVYTECEVCQGAGYNRETLEVLYKGKNISEVLNMCVDEAYEFFFDIPQIKQKLKLLREVGLGYVQLGQKSTTLSGGEAQRIKLSKELSKKTIEESFYILDEPTTGLHSQDVNNLLKILQKLVDAGNTVLVIEHNIGVIKCADHVIDIGPKGGDEGGYIVAEGTPAEVAANPKSVTGAFLLEAMKEEKEYRKIHSQKNN